MKRGAWGKSKARVQPAPVRIVNLDGPPTIEWKPDGTLFLLGQEVVWPDGFKRVAKDFELALIEPGDITLTMWESPPSTSWAIALPALSRVEWRWTMHRLVIGAASVVATVRGISESNTPGVPIHVTDINSEKRR